MNEPQCPRCRRDFVQRVHRRWGLERVLSLLYIYPFRCQLCGHRFRVQQWGVRYVRRAIDRRQYERMATSFPVTFSGAAGTGEGMVTDIALGGCGVGTTAQLVEGAILQMQLQTSPSTPAIPVEAAVVRSVRPRYVGFEFLRFEPQARERLSQFLYELLMARQRQA
jgi:PilZ domain